jgi:hypothetical protein
MVLRALKLSQQCSVRKHWPALRLQLQSWSVYSSSCVSLRCALQLREIGLLPHTSVIVCVGGM